MNPFDMTSKRFFPFISFFLLLISSANAQKNHRKLGINFEEYAYPYPAQIFAFRSQQQSLQMAYMYEKATEPNGKTIMLLHGKNFNGAYWGQTMQALLQNGFNVVVPDQIGFGKSSKPAHYQFTFQQLAKNTKSLLDSLGIDQTIVLGHSMGGMVAARFALMYPKTTSKLVLEDPLGLEDWKRKVPYQGVDKWYEGELGKSRQSIKKYMSKSYYDNHWKPAYDEWLYLRTAFMDSPDYKRYAWGQALTTDMVFTQPVLYEFGELKMPVLLIIGQRDHTAIGTNSVPDSVAATMGNYSKLGKETAKAIPKSTLVELDGVGHLPHIEAFDRFFEVLMDHLK